MRLRALLAGILAVCLYGATEFAQSPATVDFARDVQPIFKENCYGCHGPMQQGNGFRLDRRRDAMRGGTVAVIGPGNSAGSRLYQRLIGNRFGRQMPPTAPLRAEQVAIVKAWIDQGAQWPDELSGDRAMTVPDPAAERLVTALSAGDAAGFRAALAGSPAAVNQKGAGGTTPLMAAALHADAATVRDLLERGADPNLRNDVGATALMWAVDDVEKVRALVERGADVNAVSMDARTALMIAAGLRDSAPVVTLLLERGATLDARAPAIFGATTPLVEAAAAGNEEVFRMLVAAGASLRLAGPPAVGMSLRAGCMSCAGTLLKAFDAPLLTGTLVGGTPPRGPSLGIPMLLASGASPAALDEDGRTMLMLAAASEAMPLDGVAALLERGADVNAKTEDGETALTFARRHGRTPMVDALVKAGASDPPDPPRPRPSPAASHRAAIARSLPLLQRTDEQFLKTSGCVSCHNNSLTAMTVAAARAGAMKVDEPIASGQAAAIGRYLDEWRERALQGASIPGDVDTASYILVGLAAANYPPDAGTDAQARLLMQRQASDGHWRIFAHRPPIESSDVEVTAMAMHALQSYAPRLGRPAYDRAVAAAAAWLETATPRNAEDRAFRLLGLGWAHASRAAIDGAARAVLAEQRPDGGWAQLPSMESDAYATGQAIVALVQSGAMPASTTAYRRAAAYLLKTQLADGSWYVQTRALPVQPLFDTGFPHGRDAFISAAATNWATTALAYGTVVSRPSSVVSPKKSSVGSR